jgi:hypothetical protein
LIKISAENTFKTPKLLTVFVIAPDNKSATIANKLRQNSSINYTSEAILMDKKSVVQL